jgi:predicted GTPase
VVVVNKVDSAAPADVEAVVAAIGRLAPTATVVRAASPVTLEGAADHDGPKTPAGSSSGSLAGQRVLVVEDGPTITHGGMPFGAGTVAARAAGAAELVDPRPWAVGSIAATYERYPAIGAVLPAMGYGATQLADLAATVAAAPVDVVVSGTPMDLGRLLPLGHPVRRARYEYADAGTPTLADALAPWVDGVVRGLGR